MSAPLNKRAFLAGLLVWLCLIGPGAKWATNPVLHPPGKVVIQITPADTARAFPVRFVPLPPPATNNVATAKPSPGAMKSPATKSRFNYENWAWRESRRRLLVFFIAWCVAGVLIQWAMTRVFREPAAKAG